MENDLSTADLLMQRFPKLGLLTPPFSIQGMAEELFPTDLEKVEVLYVYGIGEGAAYKQLKEWLWKKPERKLIFLEDDLRWIASFLRTEGAKELLKDERVFIEFLEQTESLAQRWPVRHVEIIPLPSRKGRRFWKLREELLRKTALSFALHIDRLHGYQPFENFLRNVRRLPESFYANGLKGGFSNVPAIVCGAGPSLDKAISDLAKAKERALLIAGGSTVAALSSEGIMPHFAMAIDPNLEEYRRFRNSFAFDVPLLYSTRLFPGVFQTCNGPFGYMRSGIGGAPELWIEEELGLSDPLLGEHLSQEAISVTAICLAWAVFLGCNPIFLSGIDLAYTANKRYAKGIGEEESFISQLEKEKSAPDRMVKRKDRQGRYVYTAVRWLIEAQGLAHFAKKSRGVQFFHATEGGLPIRGIAHRSLEEIVSMYPKRDLRAEVQRQIAASPMPLKTEEIVGEKLKELKESLDQVIAHLEILAKEKKGSSALAEMELREELAFAVLFYDADGLFQGEKWRQFLDLARKYRKVFDSAFTLRRRERHIRGVYCEASAR